MKPITTSGVAESVRARLLTLAKERKEDYNLVLTRYALERFLYRLSLSEHRSELILSPLQYGGQGLTSALKRSKEVGSDCLPGDSESGAF